jgi:dienelactone hydrolase
MSRPLLFLTLLLTTALLSGCASGNEDDADDRQLSGGRFSKLSEKLKLAGESVEVDFFLPKTSRPAPLVVVAHGFSRSRKNFEGWGERLAKAGYFAAIPDLPASTDHKQNGHAIEELIQLLATRPPQKLRSAQIEADRVAVVGHSAGGLATLLAASDNRRIVLWVGLDPVDSGDIGASAADDRTFAALVLLAEDSRCNQRENISGLQKRLRGPWLIAKVDGAGHCDPENPTSKGCTIPCGGGYSERRHNIFARYTLDALDAVLRDDPAATARLSNLKKDKNLKEIRGSGFSAARPPARAARTRQIPGASAAPKRSTPPST